MQSVTGLSVYESCDHLGTLPSLLSLTDASSLQDVLNIVMFPKKYKNFQIHFRLKWQETKSLCSQTALDSELCSTTFKMNMMPGILNVETENIYWQVALPGLNLQTVFPMFKLLWHHTKTTTPGLWCNTIEY